jgi:hypothetical protein
LGLTAEVSGPMSGLVRLPSNTFRDCGHPGWAAQCHKQSNQLYFDHLFGADGLWC